MPNMSDNRRRRIVARQKKLENAEKRTEKAAKRARNSEGVNVSARAAVKAAR